MPTATTTDLSPYIPTANGRALVWYDDRPGIDGGWVLRYHRAPETAHNALGLRDLDEILPCYDPEDPAAARAAAIGFLRREAITVL